MRRLIRKGLMMEIAAGITLLVVTAVVAQSGRGGALPDVARIVTSGAQPEQCLSRIHVQEIDGEAVSVHDSGFDLEPGMHSLNGRAFLDTTFCRPGAGRTMPPVPDLSAEFEAGKTYYIGLDHAAPDAAEWRLVIWKVEPESDPRFPN